MPNTSSRSVKISYPAHSREEVLQHLEERVAALRDRLPCVQRVVLFGSYATGRHTAASDIDLLVVYAGNPVPDAYQAVKKTVGLRGLEPHVYAEAEARAVAGTLRRMTRDGVTIFDDEQS